MNRKQDMVHKGQKKNLFSEMHEDKFIERIPEEVVNFDHSNRLHQIVKLRNFIAKILLVHYMQISKNEK